MTILFSFVLKLVLKGSVIKRKAKMIRVSLTIFIIIITLIIIILLLLLLLLI